MDNMHKFVGPETQRDQRFECIVEPHTPPVPKTNLALSIGYFQHSYNFIFELLVGL